MFLPGPKMLNQMNNLVSLMNNLSRFNFTYEIPVDLVYLANPSDLGDQVNLVDLHWYKSLSLIVYVLARSNNAKSVE
jgi:hypothetical protein